MVWYRSGTSEESLASFHVTNSNKYRDPLLITPPTCVGDETHARNGTEQHLIIDPVEPKASRSGHVGALCGELPRERYGAADSDVSCDRQGKDVHRRSASCTAREIQYTNQKQPRVHRCEILGQIGKISRGFRIGHIGPFSQEQGAVLPLLGHDSALARRAVASATRPPMLRAPNKPSPTAKLIEDLAAKIEEERRCLPAVAFMFSYQRYASARSILKEIQGTTTAHPIGALRLLELLVRRRPRRYAGGNLFSPLTILKQVHQDDIAFSCKDQSRSKGISATR